MKNRPKFVAADLETLPGPGPIAAKLLDLFRSKPANPMPFMSDAAARANLIQDAQLPKQALDARMNGFTRVKIGLFPVKQQCAQSCACGTDCGGRTRWPGANDYDISRIS
jgi:hypothetical protein